VNGACAGGGYELALACDENPARDDPSSAVSCRGLAAGGAPRHRGLTRWWTAQGARDLGDVFSSLGEGVKGQAGGEWRLVDETVPLSPFSARVAERARPWPLGTRAPGPGVALAPLAPPARKNRTEYRHVTLEVNPDARWPISRSRVRRRGAHGGRRHARAGDDLWARGRSASWTTPSSTFGSTGRDRTVVLLTRGKPSQGPGRGRGPLGETGGLFLGEVRHHQKRVLKRLDLTARSLFALVDESSCFAGSLFELALAADRSYMLAAPTGRRSRSPP